MIYPEYRDLKTKYLEAQRLFGQAVDEKERLFSMTQPKAVITDKINVQGGATPNVFEKYLIEKEEREIDKNIAEAKSILTEREHILRLKEIELRQSNHIYDKVCRMYFLDGLKPFTISRKLHYSKSQIYRIVERFK